MTAKTLWVLLVVTATLPFWDLGHPLWEVDDARYAEIPREMVVEGDWLTPQLNGIEYLQKPPLIYWIDALSYKTFGVSEAASRVPLALLSLLGMAGAAWLGTWLFSRTAGLSAAVILGTCVEYSCLSHLQTPDMALSVCLLWCSAFILRALHRPDDARWAGPGAGVCAGLAFLSKGLVGFVFPAGWAATLAFLFPELRRGFKALCRGSAAWVAAAIVIPWIWAMERAHPNFMYHFFIEHHFLRYLTPEFQREGPWYYFIGIDLGGLLPWTPIVAAASLIPFARWKTTDVRLKELALWTGMVFVFFSASKSKLPTYILPILPHQCVLAGAWLDGDDNAEEGHWARAAAVGLAFLMILAIPIAWMLWPKFAPGLAIPESLRWTGTTALAALAVASACLAALGRKPSAFTGTAAAAWMLTGLLLIGARQCGPLFSAKEVSDAIDSLRRPGDRVIAYGSYLHGIVFYTKMPVDVLVNWFGEFRVAERDPRYQGRFGDDHTIRALPSPGRTTFVVARRRDEQTLLSLPSSGSLRELRTFGDTILAVY